MADSIPVEPYNAQAARRQGQENLGDVSVSAQPRWVDRITAERNPLPNSGASGAASSIAGSNIGSRLSVGAKGNLPNPDEIVRDFQTARQQARLERQAQNPGAAESQVTEIQDSSQAAVAVVKNQGLKYIDLAASQFWVGFSILSVAAAVTAIGVILTILAAIAVASGTVLATLLYLYNGRELNLIIALLPPRLGFSNITEMEGDVNFAIVLAGLVAGILFVVAIIALIASAMAEFGDLLSITGV